MALWHCVVGFFLPYFCRVKKYTKLTELIAGAALVQAKCFTVVPHSQRTPDLRSKKVLSS